MMSFPVQHGVRAQNYSVSNPVTCLISMVPHTAYISFFFRVCFVLLLVCFCFVRFVFVLCLIKFLLVFSSFAVGKVENALLWRLHGRTRCCIATFFEFGMRSSGSSLEGYRGEGKLCRR